MIAKSPISLNSYKWFSFIFILISICLLVQAANAQSMDSARYFFQQYEYGKAINQLDRMEVESNNLEYLELNAKAHKSLHKYSEAINAYKQLISLDSTDLQYLIEIADCYQTAGNYKEAEYYLKMAHLTSPDNIYIKKELGDLFYKNVKYDSALTYYNNIYQQESSFYYARQIGRCFTKLELIDTAIYFFQKALEDNPTDFNTLYQLAEIYKKKVDYDQAISYTDTYLAYDSMNLKMLKMRGYLNFLNKHFGASINDLEKCYMQNDSSEFVRKFLGLGYYKRAQYFKAQPHLMSAFKSDTSNLSLCYALGITSNLTYDYELGVLYLNKTLQLSIPEPDFLSMVYQDLALVKINLSRFEEALIDYLEAYRHTPGDALLLFKMGIHYDQNLKDMQNALKYYQKFMTTRPPVNDEGDAADNLENNELNSYYDYVDGRISEIKEEMFMGKNASKSN